MGSKALGCAKWPQTGGGKRSGSCRRVFTIGTVRRESENPMWRLFLPTRGNGGSYCHHAQGTWSDLALLLYLTHGPPLSGSEDLPKRRHKIVSYNYSLWGHEHTNPPPPRTLPYFDLCLAEDVLGFVDPRLQFVNFSKVRALVFSQEL
jgi:hypothetical protein